MLFKEGNPIWLPQYDILVAKYGLKERNGMMGLNTKPYWDSNGKMENMCAQYHTITDVHPNKIYLESPENGLKYGFAKQIFEDFKEKGKKAMNKKININNIVLKQLKHRYEFVNFDMLQGGQKNYGILDSIYPYQTVRKEIGKQAFTKGRTGCVAISERIARDLQVPQLHIQELVAIHGYTKTAIKDILLAVKKKKFKICVIGYGGTGTNFLHWLSKMAEWTNMTKIFEDLVIADEDYFDSVNLLRVPFILPEMNNIQRKVKYFNDYAHLSKDTYKQEINVTSTNLFREHIHYGAPDLETRKMLHDENVPFIAATHRDNACALMQRPELDTELMVETYGKIALTPFFMNHIKMTITFMEHLAKENTTVTSLKGKEESILSYDFVVENKNFIDNGDRFNGRTMYPVIADEFNRIDIDIGD